MPRLLQPATIGAFTFRWSALLAFIAAKAVGARLLGVSPWSCLRWHLPRRVKLPAVRPLPRACIRRAGEAFVRNASAHLPHGVSLLPCPGWLAQATLRRSRVCTRELTSGASRTRRTATASAHAAGRLVRLQVRARQHYATQAHHDEEQVVQRGQLPVARCGNKNGPSAGSNSLKAVSTPASCACAQPRVKRG